MDTGKGSFVKFEGLEDEPKLRKKYPTAKDIFTIGEDIEIKGSHFRVKEITPFGIKLKLLKGSINNV